MSSTNQTGRPPMTPPDPPTHPSLTRINGVRIRTHRQKNETKHSKAHDAHVLLDVPMSSSLDESLSETGVIVAAADARARFSFTTSFPRLVGGACAEDRVFAAMMLLLDCEECSFVGVKRESKRSGACCCPTVGVDISGPERTLVPIFSNIKSILVP